MEQKESTEQGGGDDREVKIRHKTPSGRDQQGDQCGQHYCHFLTDLIKHVDKPTPLISICLTFTLSPRTYATRLRKKLSFAVLYTCHISESDLSQEYQHHATL